MEKKLFLILIFHLLILVMTIHTSRWQHCVVATCSNWFQPAKSSSQKISHTSRHQYATIKK